LSGRSSARELDRNIDRVLAGETEIDSDDGQLLPTARRLAALARPRAEPAARSLARDLFLAEADARRARWVHSHHVPAVAPPPPKKGIQLGQLSALLATLLIAVLLGGVLAAVASFSTPDSPFYGVKRSGENVLLQLSRDPVSRSDMDVNLAEERLREAEGMAAASKPDVALDTLETRYDELRDAGDRLAAAQPRDARWKGAVTRYLAEAQKPVTPLEHQLTQKGFPTWAAQAGSMAGDFQQYLDQVKPRLGVTNAAPGAAPQPSPPAPSPSS
jgi:Domain of unknown function (DUF5667)